MKTAFLPKRARTEVGKLVMCWKVNNWKGTTWRWRQRAPKHVGVLVKHLDLVDVRLCIKCSLRNASHWLALQWPLGCRSSVNIVEAKLCHTAVSRSCLRRNFFIHSSEAPVRPCSVASGLCYIARFVACLNTWYSILDGVWTAPQSKRSQNKPGLFSVVL